MTPAPPPAEIRECGAADAGFFQRIREWASSNPALAFTCAPLLRTDEQRDFVLRQAFASALQRDPQTARRYLPEVIGRPWIAEAGFHPAMRLAREANSKPLLLAAVRRNPSLGLREVAGYIDLPFGQEVFDEAAALAPDEAAGLALGNSVTSLNVMRCLLASPRPEIQTIAAIAKDPTLAVLEREKVPVFFRQIAAGRMTVAEAARRTAGEQFFQSIAQLRLGSPLYDQVLERAAQILLRTYTSSSPNLNRLSAAELYLLLAYGRTEEDDELFDTIFDKFLLPKMRTQKLGVAGTLRLRGFLAAAAVHQKLNAFTSAIGDPDLIARTIPGIDSIDEAMEAAEMIDAVSSPQLFARLKPAIESAHRQAPRDGALYGFLALRLARRMNITDWPLASQYARYYTETARLDTNSLFNAANTCVQRYFFYNDEDGIDSFQSFLSEYSKDPAWKLERFPAYVHLSAAAAGGRRIEIYANQPKEDSQAVISQLLAEKGVEPTVFVHRGHSFHVEKSLRYLTPASKLIYLGSCRGLGVTATAIGRATEAQLIVTRGVGTMDVNDPVLKAINTELLTRTQPLEWNTFWRTLEGRFSGSATFHDYIPPNRNSSAAMMSAYFNYLTEPRTAASETSAR
ncbi:MAG: hypothetical protein ABJF23_19900 [Bryobacteraceae bacterium]